jgi:hypothetical protein
LKKLQKTTPKNNGKPCKYATHNVVMFPIFANSQFLEQFHNTDYYNLVPRLSTYPNIKLMAAQPRV